MPDTPIVFDEDNPEWTEEDFAAARPIEDFPQLAAAFPKARGRPKGSLTSAKRQVTLRLDRDVIAHFTAGGAGWQSRINAELRKAIGG